MGRAETVARRDDIDQRRLAQPPWACAALGCGLMRRGGLEYRAGVHSSAEEQVMLTAAVSFCSSELVNAAGRGL